MPPLNSTRRFSSRVNNYVKFRPGYPRVILDLLREKCDLSKTSVVADIGSGTGILTKMLLENGNPVLGIEPNHEMREAAERFLGRFPAFTSISGTAETTTLKNQSVDLVTAGQAFHWFDPEQARGEFIRILKRDGWAVLIWNERNINNAFARAYEQLLKTYGTDYEAVNHRHMNGSMIDSFYARQGCQKAAFSNVQVFDLAGLTGRLLSSSYAPEEGHPAHVPMLKALAGLFQEQQEDGKIAFDYRTVVYYGRLTN